MLSNALLGSFTDTTMATAKRTIFQIRIAFYHAGKGLKLPSPPSYVAFNLGFKIQNSVIEYVYVNIQKYNFESSIPPVVGGIYCRTITRDTGSVLSLILAQDFRPNPALQII